jgi:hypothetical protein
MTISAIVEVGVGLVLVYYIFSYISSGITTWIARIIQLDAKRLEEGLLDLFEDPDRLGDIMNHPWVRILRPKKLNLLGNTVNEEFEDWRAGKRVTWIPPETFAKVLTDVLAPGEDSLGDIHDIRRAIIALPPGKLKSHLLGMVNKSVTSVEAFRSNVEAWFNDAMKGVSQVYRKNTKQIVMAVAFLLTVGLNVDTIAIGTALWKAPTSRAIATATADEIIQAGQPDEEIQFEEVRKQVESLEDIGIPLLWHKEYVPQNSDQTIAKVAGLVISWVALAQGSPFWYDMLKRLRGRYP